MAEFVKSLLTSDPSLVSYWQFESNTNDFKSGNTLTLAGSPVYTTGRFGNGLDLELSSSQYAYISDASQTGLDITGDISIELWIKLEQLPSSIPDFMVLVAKGTSNTTRSYELRIGSNDKPFFWFSDDGTENAGHYRTFECNTSLSAANVGAWTHIAVTCDVNPATAVFYINGEVASNTAGGATAVSIYNSNSDFSIGVRKQATPVYYTDGVIDDVAIFSRVLTSADVQSIYFSGTVKFYPDASPGITTTDTSALGTNAVWATCRALATASFATDNAAATIYTEAYTGYAIHRAFLLFNTASIPANARITYATLTLYKNATAISNGDLSSCCLVASIPASNTAVQDVDFDQVGTTRLATDVTYASMAVSTPFTFTLNADGLAAITRGGVTKFGLRDKRDLDNSAPTGVNSIGMNSADNASNKPYLTVEYEIIGSMLTMFR